jgi:hypothetical protein
LPLSAWPSYSYALHLEMGMVFLIVSRVKFGVFSRFVRRDMHDRKGSIVAEIANLEIGHACPFLSSSSTILG